MQKVRKTAAELEAIVRAEAVRVIGPWPVGLRMLIYPLGDNWRATFSGTVVFRSVTKPNMRSHAKRSASALRAY
jgi:hypothetical protein